MIVKQQPLNKVLQLVLVPLIYFSAPIVLAQAQTPSVDNLDDSANEVQLRQQIQSYEQAIALSDGAYADTSAELYLSLANGYRALGDLEKASLAYQERLQALRISLGLFSQEQITTIADYNELLFQVGDLEKIDRNFHLSYHVASKLYDRQDPRFIKSATQLASWKIKAFESGLFEVDNDSSIDEAAQIYQDLAEQVPASDKDYYDKRSNYLSAKGLAHFHAAKYFADLAPEYFQAFVSSAGSQQQCYSLVMSADGAQPARSVCPEMDIGNPDMFMARQIAKSETVRRHLSSMRESFANALESIENDPSASPKKLALATLNLGDASLLAQDYGRANTQYARAWDILTSDGGSVSMRDELLGQPTLVMRGVLEEVVIDQSLQQNELVGTISFDVTRKGEIENIDIQGGAQALDPDNIAALAIKLDQTTFRPKITDGKTVSSRIILNAADL
jgi:hypothetical protein